MGGDVNSVKPSQQQKLLISSDDVELNHEKLEQAYQEVQADGHTLDDDEEFDNEDEETRFIASNRSSFYTSSERT